MAVIEVAIICFSVVTCVSSCAIAYYLSEQRKAVIQQNGITQRLAMKSGIGEGGTASGHTGQWWENIAVELLKNPQIQNMIIQKIPGLNQTMNEVQKSE